MNDVVIGQASNGVAWALPPSKAMVRDGALMRDDAGKIRYAPVVEWGSRDLQDEFSRRVVALVRAKYPDALDPAEGGR
jgi:hypothetical protein